MVHAIASHLRRLRLDQRGATGIEYGLIAAGICLALITVISNLGVALSSTYAQIESWL